MAKMNPYLNFDGKTEAAFNFYKSVFGGDFMEPVHKMGEVPGCENLPADEKNRVMHVALPINDKGDVLMGSDTMPSAGHV